MIKVVVMIKITNDENKNDNEGGHDNSKIIMATTIITLTLTVKFNYYSAIGVS